MFTSGQVEKFFRGFGSKEVRWYRTPDPSLLEDANKITGSLQNNNYEKGCNFSILFLTFNALTKQNNKKLLQC